jgi:hypothetical protein
VLTAYSRQVIGVEVIEEPKWGILRRHAAGKMDWESGE